MNHSGPCGVGVKINGFITMRTHRISIQDMEKALFDEGFTYNTLLDKLIYTIPRIIANRSRMKYERYLRHLFSIT